MLFIFFLFKIVLQTLSTTFSIFLLRTSFSISHDTILKHKHEMDLFFVEHKKNKFTDNNNNSDIEKL